MVTFHLIPQWKPKSEGGFDPQSVPVQVYPSVYVLKLENGCYYVGLSTADTGVEQRLTRHLMNIGANWVQQHKAIAVVDFYYPATKELENAVTIPGGRPVYLSVCFSVCYAILKKGGGAGLFIYGK
eukprot:COSAG01_NODE_2268_length_8031_cov_70.657341_2_plen_126_part_00